MATKTPTKPEKPVVREFTVSVPLPPKAKANKVAEQLRALIQDVEIEGVDESARGKIKVKVVPLPTV